MSKSFVNPDNTLRADGTGAEYSRVIADIAERDECPFCSESLAKYHKNPILREGAFWLVTDNMYPYEGAKNQILFIHKDHIEHLSDVSPGAWQELHRLAAWISDERDIRGGTFYLRFGETEYTGASVRHLHANLISPDVENPKRKPIVTRIG